MIIWGQGAENGGGEELCCVWQRGSDRYCCWRMYLYSEEELILSEIKALTEEAKILNEKELSTYFLMNASSMNADPITCT